MLKSVSEFDCNEDEKETRVEKSPVGHENEDNDDSHNDDESDDSENNENDEDVDRIESFILAVGSEGSDLLVRTFFFLFPTHLISIS